jgi:CheY-like chemotaxis protein
MLDRALQQMSKILIADDSRFQVELLSRALEEKGFEVVTAVDALQASMTAMRVAPAAIVLDINMPAGSGIEVLKRLKMSSKTQHIPVMVVSGNTDPSIEPLAKQLGVTDFFHKPVDPAQLCQALSRVLSQAS